MESIGSYTNLAQIGKGGMGVVYKADNPDSMLTPVVAVKVLFGDFTDDERRRFLREARVAHELRHENIVTVFDLKETVLEEDDGSRRVPYIVMEYLSGVDLRSKLAERDFDSFEERVDLMIGVARGVAFAHEKDIIHRDIKPSNIQVTDAGLPKILDFGLARTAGSDLTMPGVQPGTPNYMSPEQVQGKEVDQRSDIFSLGAVFYEILTYKRAFGGRVTEAVQKVMKADPPPIGSAVRFVPSDLCDLVHMMLKKSPRKRPQAMREIVDKLEFARRALPVRINAIRQQTIEYLQQISELKEKHRDVLEASGDDDVEATFRANAAHRGIHRARGARARRIYGQQRRQSHRQGGSRRHTVDRRVRARQRQESARGRGPRHRQGPKVELRVAPLGTPRTGWRDAPRIRAVSVPGDPGEPARPPVVHFPTGT